MDDTIMPVLSALVERVKLSSFVPGYKATDQEAVGLLVARVFKWDGCAILDAAALALEDANFHKEAAAVAAMAGKVGA